MVTQKKLTPKIRIFFVCNYSFKFSGKLIKKKLFIKSFLFFLYVFKAANLRFKLKMYKKKKNKINILNAPYKNKLAQRQFTINRIFFSLDLTFENSKQSPNYFFFLLKRSHRFCTLGSLFFKIIKLKTIFRLN